MAPSDVFAFVLSIVRDFAEAERVMRGRTPREAVLERSRSGRGAPVLGPEAVQAVARALEREPASGDPEAVRRCVEGTDRRTRSLLAMRYRDGMGVREIARRTKTTPDAVLAFLGRARSTLARSIEGGPPAEGT
ncbi:MAG TPA: hypothetical protein VEN81_11140 [Planctomycetota bacterium]|jgi:DNA-directed RNA polymerase specialized sigma24 family protein|nr:hypothetical protein [Planctomycetota bacterium]